MRKYLYALMLFLMPGFLTAAPGDTTWVQAHQIQLNYFNSFDTVVVFPDQQKTYRKILMFYTMGQYNCPANEQYCHQWDYTIRNYALPHNGKDTVEIARLISPFATSGWSRFGNNWKQPYVFDVTNLYPILQDTVTLRMRYEGYSGGFTADVKFAFIEGTPDRNVLEVKSIYDNSRIYGNPANPINDHFPEKNVIVPQNTQAASLGYIVTGHGSDNNQCCEFDSHYFDVLLNQTPLIRKTIWRDDCNMNHLYPQGGTWIYSRANWCPGATVEPYYFDLPNIATEDSFKLQLRFEDYTATQDFGSYSSNAFIFFYDSINKNLDASLEIIMAPTTAPNYYRLNPLGTKPLVSVHNSGRTVINSIKLEYGIKDSTVHTYTWQGNLLPLQDTIIELPNLTELTNMSINEIGGQHQFNVVIKEVNDQVDDDETNNSLSSEFEIAPLWASDLIIRFKTSNFTTSANGGLYIGNPNQKWEITDMDGNRVKSRDQTNPNTTYVDTFALPAAGTYKLTIYSGNGFGLHWWPYDNVSQISQGSFSVSSIDGNRINLRNYQNTGTARDDFGKEYSTYFTVAQAGNYTGIESIEDFNQISVYPNPAQDEINIQFQQEPKTEMSYRLVNLLGQTVYETHNNHKRHNLISTKTFASGVYLLEITNQTTGQKKTEKVVLQK